MNRGPGLLLAAAAGVLVVAATVAWPVPAGELALDRASSLRVLARDGTLLRELASRTAEGHAAPARLDALPPHVWQAFVAAEDKRFWTHPGIDPLAMLRSLREDVRRGRFAQGASTIPQQLARLLRPHPRGLAGKLTEALFALRLSAHLGKREILEQYLTRVPLGNDVRGVESAARLYFDRPASALTPLQAALLAALPRSPAALNPLRQPARARTAALRVLARMEACGYLRASDFAGAPLDLATERFARSFEAAHFVEEAARHRTPEGAVAIETTLDLALQREVESAVREQVLQLQGRNASSAAALVIDNDSGEVLAWVGSPDWFDEAHAGRIDAVRTLRQPGSTLKPFAYARALELGAITPATLLSDVESHFSAASGDYVPKNYDRRAHGPVRARVALASSYNVPAVRVAEKISAQELLRTLHRAGFDSLDREAEHYGLGLVLGDGEVTLQELARAYAGLARGGVVQDLTLVRRALDAHGQPLPRAPPAFAPRRMMSSAAAALVTDMLADSAARAPAFGLDNVLRLPFPVAAKTGTSRAFTDNWTAGSTRERTVAVWVGNMSGETMRHVSGITGAGPLFQRVMTLAMAGIEKPAPLWDDRTLETQEVCALSGQLASPFCPSRVRERFAAGTAPRAPCEMHSQAGLDLGARFYDWAAHEGVDTLSRASTGAARAALAFPADGDEFLRSPDLPDAAQTIPVRALAPAGGAALELSLDGGERTALRAPFSTRVPARRGRHELRLYRRGLDAPDARVSFEVKG
jgi:penicillin-binding protein 1C